MNDTKTDDEGGPMNKMLVAVFGHYDSRGGTMAVPLEERTVEAVRRAIDKYNEYAFGWSKTLEDYKRDPEQWAWDPTQPGSSPGEKDFMYVAELHYPEGADPSGDLEEMGAVAVQGGEARSRRDIQPLELDPDDLDVDGQIRRVVEGQPVTLEFIPLGMSRYDSQGDTDDDVWARIVLTRAKVVDPARAEVPDWNDDAFGFMIGTDL